MDLMSTLFARATGGSDVAARPVEEDQSGAFWSLTPRPVGVQAIQDWFKANLNLDNVAITFLVGGPGGGKSHAAAQMVSGMSENNPLDPDLAHRRHDYFDDKSGKSVLLVNDATILRSDDSGPSSLVTDIADAISSNSNLIACVNRGILVDEARNASGSSLEEAILNWLINVQGPSDVASSPVTTTFANGILQEGFATSGGVVIRIGVVFFDTTSLFERAPKSGLLSEAGESSRSLFCDEYDLAPFSERMKGVVVDSAAYKLLSILLNEFHYASSIPLDINPVAANLASLSKLKLLQSVTSICRGAEIVGDRHFTYRELWGIAARLIVGSLPEQVSASGLEKKLKSLSPRGSDPLEIFTGYQDLANLRFSQAIFGNQISLRRDDLATLQDPVLRTMALVDPVRDMQPQTLLEGEDVSLSDVISDAFSGTVSNESPLLALKNLLSPNNEFHNTVTVFDEALDAAFVEAMVTGSLKDSQRSKFVSWYSSYLARLLACANSVPAFPELLELWTEIWRMGQFPTPEIEENFLTLMRPSRTSAAGEGGESSLIPIFESRTSPIVGALAHPKFALRVDDLKLRIKTDGDRIFLVLEEHNSQVSTILLDFSLLREAMSCISKFPGVTELSAFTAPRLERFRAANLVPGRQSRSNQYRIALEVGEKAIRIKEGAS